MMKIDSHKKALVAGGAGFIGSHLCDKLVKEGYEVLCLDNLYTGRMENIWHLLENSNFSFQYVDDLIEAMMWVVKTGDNFTGTVNLGNPNEIAIRSLASMIISLTKSHSNVISKPLPQNDPKRRCPDIFLAIRLLNSWIPKVKIEDGLRKTIDCFRDECL